MTNPISANARAKIYVLGIIVGALATVVPTILAALQVPPSWTTVAVSTIGLITTISSILARGNLTLDDASTVESGVAEVSSEVKAARAATPVSASAATSVSAPTDVSDLASTPAAA